jgi:hypothetical protein
MALGSAAGVREGMVVVGSDGSAVGEVKQVRDEDFLVNRSLERDVYVPLDAVREVLEDLVVLNIRGDEVDGMHWPVPE